MALFGSANFVRFGFSDKTAIEVTLAACCAVWLARRSNAMIQVDWGFWTTATIISPDELVEQICVRNIDGLKAACQRLVGTRVIDE